MFRIGDREKGTVGETIGPQAALSMGVTALASQDSAGSLIPDVS